PRAMVDAIVDVGPAGIVIELVDENGREARLFKAQGQATAAGEQVDCGQDVLLHSAASWHWLVRRSSQSTVSARATNPARQPLEDGRASARIGQLALPHRKHPPTRPPQRSCISHVASPIGLELRAPELAPSPGNPALLAMVAMPKAPLDE